MARNYRIVRTKPVEYFSEDGDMRCPADCDGQVIALFSTAGWETRPVRRLDMDNDIRVLTLDYDNDDGGTDNREFQHLQCNTCSARITFPWDEESDMTPDKEFDDLAWGERCVCLSRGEDCNPYNHHWVLVEPMANGQPKEITYS